MRSRARSSFRLRVPGLREFPKAQSVLLACIVMQEPGRAVSKDWRGYWRSRYLRRTRAARECRGIRPQRRSAWRNGVAVEFLDIRAPLAFVADIVIANILANPLILLAPVLASRCKRGGRIALSGILSSQVHEVEKSYAPWIAF